MAGSGSQRQSEQILMGRIGAAHGIKGEVRIQSFCATPLDILTYGPFQTDRSDAPLRIRSARMQKDMLIARIEGVGDRNAAELLNGAELFADRARLPANGDADDFYVADLIGLDVVGTGGEPVGTVTHVENFGAGDLVELRFISGKTGLFAFTRATFPQIDIEKRIATFAPPLEIVIEGEE